MHGFRCIVAVVLAFVLAASAAVHGARAAGMAMPMATAWSAEGAAPCELCGGGTAAEAAAQCAFACAGLSGVIGDPMRLLEECCGTPTAIAPAASAGRVAAPEPGPPR